MSLESPRAIVIDRRFRGPEHSGNGGYVAGVLAGALGGVAEVTLRAPPPLDRKLLLKRIEGGVVLADGDQEIALAKPGAIQSAPPPAPSLEDAEAATKRYSGFTTHIYPGCFVCGTERGAGDGLRIFAGPLAGRDQVAAVWSADSIDGGGDGRVRPEILWAALDCPSYFGLMRPGLRALLGRMTAEIFARPAVGERCIVAGWSSGSEGRKHFGGSALYSAAGDVLGVAQTTWIALQPEAS